MAYRTHVAGTGRGDECGITHTLFTASGKIYPQDLPNLPQIDPIKATHAAVEALLNERKPDHITYNDWQILDMLETQNGQAQDRPRLKYSRIDEMIDTVEKTRRSQPLAPLP